MTKTELKALRLRLGLSTAEASRQVHITQRSWLRYESGTRPIPEGVVELFCIKNGVRYVQKLFFEEAGTIPPEVWKDLPK